MVRRYVVKHSECFCETIWGCFKLHLNWWKFEGADCPPTCGWALSNQLKTLRVEDCGPLVAQMVKSLPAVQETQVQSLSQKEPLEKEMATHCSILAWRIPRTEEPGRLWAMIS